MITSKTSVLSNNTLVLPLGKLYLCEAYITKKDKTFKAMADQIMTVSKKRLIDKIGVLSADEMIDVEHILKVQLGLP